ncbi:amidohydrolase family protein [Aurantimonas sp. A2-1-M11]|uniref:amidohydrolase family protein n=1 Tax=Aurantimonas sp. A2-1-M11 TaxID=3113712 RepID=UPI002F92F29A
MDAHTLDDVAIVDAHHHLWKISENYLPWLCDPTPIPFRYGDYAAIRRDYMPEDYRRDTAGLPLAGSVYVETEWDPTDPVGETSWIHGIAEANGFPDAVVCQAWLDADDAGDVLARQSAFPRTRGVRHKPKAADRPDAVSPGAPGSMGDPRWRQGFAKLEPNGLSFDLQTPWWHLAEAADLADAFPGTQIILNHTGLPSDRSREGIAAWAAAMAHVARAPNVAVKISGLGVPGSPWTAETNREIVLRTIETFGVERCLFASNFPVDSLVASYRTIYEGFSQITANFSREDRTRLFADNARRLYRFG